MIEIQQKIKNLTKWRHREGVDREETDVCWVQHVRQAHHLCHTDAQIQGQEAQAHQASNHHCEEEYKMKQKFTAVNFVSIFSVKGWG